MDNELITLSEQLAKIVESTARYVVAVETHPRVPASGIYWQPGVVVTVEHALKGLTEAEVTFPDGAKGKGTLAGKDEATGLAAFRVLESDLPAPSLAITEGLKPGNLTVAVGRSVRSGPTASMGVISAVSGAWRTWRGGNIDRFVQLDYGLYPNSNGGAVVDTKGNLIGVATSAFSRFGGVAIPAATVNRVLPSLLDSGYVRRGYLGVGLRAVPMPESMRHLLLEPAATAVIVLSVEDGAAGHRAGLFVGDIIAGFEQKPVHDSDDVQALLGPESVGSTITAHIIRGGQRLDVAIEVGERNREE